MEIVAALLLMLAALLGWALNILGLPGNWFVIAAAAIYAYLVDDQSRLDISWVAVVVLVVLAVVGEVIEFAAGALGASRSGGSKRGAVLAIAGSFVGGIAGMFVGIPVPVVGPLIGALLFAGLGALAGAVVGEQWKGRDLDESLRIGQAAFWGRLLGTLGKVVVGAVMIVMIFVALLVGP